MTAIAATATREEKRAWLLRPLDWALTVATLGSALTLVNFMLYGPETAAAVGFVSLVGEFGVVLWAISRIATVTR